jgi:hypothetical protein
MTDTRSDGNPFDLTKASDFSDSELLGGLVWFRCKRSRFSLGAEAETGYANASVRGQRQRKNTSDAFLLGSCTVYATPWKLE